MRLQVHLFRLILRYYPDCQPEPMIKEGAILGAMRKMWLIWESVGRRIRALGL